MAVQTGFIATPRCSQRDRLEGEDCEGALEAYLDCKLVFVPNLFNPLEPDFLRTGCNDAGFSLNAYSLIVSLVFFRLYPKNFFGGGEGFDNSFSFAETARPFVWLLLVPFKQLGPTFKGVFLTLLLIGDGVNLVAADYVLQLNNR